MNVLITSVSRKVPLVQAFREAGATVWGADADPECVARYFADHFWEMPPPAAEPLRRFCERHRIELVIPTRDGELAFFAEHRDDLPAYVSIGALDGVRTCLDKLAFHRHCRAHGIPTPPTATALDELDGDTFVVKERRGAGSRALAIGVDRAAATAYAARLEQPIFQPVLHGTEHSVDLYVNRDGRVVEAAPRTRIRVPGRSARSFRSRRALTDAESDKVTTVAFVRSASKTMLMLPATPIWPPIGSPASSATLLRPPSAPMRYLARMVYSSPRSRSSTVTVTPKSSCTKDL